MNMKVNISLFAFFLLVTSLYSCNNKRFNTRFTHSITSTNPYDIKFFFEQITDSSQAGYLVAEENWWILSEEEVDDDFISESTISETNDDSNFYEDNDDSSWTYFAVSKYFEPTSQEINELKNFVASGNLAFISSFNLGETLKDSLLFFVENEFHFNTFPPFLVPDSIKVNWLGDSLSQRFVYPGHRAIRPSLDSATLFSDTLGYRVTSFDTLMTEDNDVPTILRIRIGKGRLYLCSNPLVLSNYFLLHKQNYELINLLHKELELDQRSLVWDNYYNKLGKKYSGESKSEVWKIINQYPGLKLAFYTLLIGSLIYFLMYARRIVQTVPILPKNQNNSLAFVNSLAGVYWKRKDDAAIAQKLFHQFYEYLYLQHQINAAEVSEANIEKIAGKTGKSADALRHILTALNDYNRSKTISKEQLNRYYKYLSIFYKS